VVLEDDEPVLILRDRRERSVLVAIRWILRHLHELLGSSLAGEDVALGYLYLSQVTEATDGGALLPRQAPEGVRAVLRVCWERTSREGECGDRGTHNR